MMSFRRGKSFIVIAILLLFAGLVQVNGEDERHSIGVQSITYGYFGFSYRWNIIDPLSVEVLVDFINVLDADYLLAYRLLYHLVRYEFSSGYVYGMVGANSLESPAGFGSSRDETAVWGAGFGCEYDMRILLDSLPAFAANFEVGLEGRGDTTYGNLGYLFLNIGFGLHFRF
jgi:hypothetical protein